MNRECSDCGKGISPQSVKGRCRVCAIAVMNRDPEYCARRAEANRRKAADPAYRAKLIRNLHSSAAKWRGTPEGKAHLSKLGREAIALTFLPGAREKWRAGRVLAGKRRGEAVMAWCPHEYRVEYRKLVRSKKMRAAEAKAFILAKLTPFERQLHAIKNGANIIEKPILRTRDYDITLGGVSDMVA